MGQVVNALTGDRYFQPDQGGTLGGTNALGAAEQGWAGESSVKLRRYFPKVVCLNGRDGFGVWDEHVNALFEGVVFGERLGDVHLGAVDVQIAGTDWQGPSHMKRQIPASGS